jgi:hypothetical protein
MFYCKYAKTTVFDGGYGVRSRLNRKTDVYANNEALAVLFALCPLCFSGFFYNIINHLKGGDSHDYEKL